jgi:hypothetical protein
VLMLSPFVLVTFSQAVLGMVDSFSRVETEPAVAEQLAQLRPRPENKVKNRVVWIIFDELDYRVPFEIKPLALPEFERFKNESLSATDARSPARDTLESIPSLLTGKPVEHGSPSGKAELILHFADQTTAKFSETNDIFSDVRALDGNAAVIGWYHSYCRTIGRRLAACGWEGDKYSGSRSLGAAMLRQAEELAVLLPLIFSSDIDLIEQSIDSNFEPEEERTREMVDAHRQRLEAVKAAVVNPELDLVFIHLPLPHPPAKYDRLTREFSQLHQDYVNNLALSDDVLGQIRRQMEEAGEWDDSTVLISTDHQWRVEHWKDSKISFTANDRALTGEIEDRRVPFMIKLKNQKQATVYDRRFNTVVSRALLLAVMKGEINAPAELKNWLDAAIAQNPAFAADQLRRDRPDR